MATYRGRLGSHYDRGLLPIDTIEIGHHVIRVNARSECLEVAASDSRTLDVHWSRPWRFEQSTGIAIGEAFFIPARLRAVLRELEACGWHTRSVGTSRSVHYLAIVVQWAIIVGFVIAASQLLS